MNFFFHIFIYIFLKLVRAAGLEPARPKSQDFKSCVSTYSTTLAFGGSCRIRTHDLLLRRQLLYPAELRNHMTRKSIRMNNHTLIVKISLSNHRAPAKKRRRKASSVALNDWTASSRTANPGVNDIGNLLKLRNIFWVEGVF